MNDRPQRPLRPDEEEELARFHNGDTLGSIPVVRPAPPPPPQPVREAGRRPRTPVIAAVALAAAVVGGLAGVGVLALTDDDGQGQRPEAAAPATTPSVAEHSTPAPDVGEPSQAPVPETSDPVVEQQSAALEQVRIIQTPATGGDPGSTFCLVYTGSSSGPERDAILLMNAPAYQCSELLPYDGVNSAFTTEAPLCEAGSRAAVVSFAEAGGWESELMYTCLTSAVGA
ncbi:hypothetical protein EF913_28365 [Streptomyces sp. WAC04189]|uniref:hypothetical protein n=1 Tax=Streptomyces sp. WAC04189 TaxID=2487411 RepID=UPI000FA02EFE|nr:hypothetical protein [Streptomyces sp. WAC04189]RSR98047.1 hypothetical protein EF913_28365 [Streptomyces sp. WAC04189]